MATENPRVPAIQAPQVERIRPPMQPGRAIETAIGSVGEQVAEEVVNVQVNSLKRELQANENEFRNEIAIQDENLNNVTGDLVRQVTGVDPSILENADPRVKEFINMQARNELAARQGILSESELAIRQERELRKAIASNPNLTSQFMNVATHAGGFGVVSLDIKNQLAGMESKQNASAAELERIRKISTDLNVNQQLYTTDPVLYWAKTAEAMADQDNLATIMRANQLQTELGKFDVRATRQNVRQGMPGIINEAYVANILPTMLQIGGSPTLGSLYERISSGAVDPVALRQGLTQAFELEKARLKSEWDSQGRISDAEFDEMLEPLAQVYDVAINSTSIESISKNVSSLIDLNRNEAILSVPNGPALVYIAELTSKLVGSGAISLGPDNLRLMRNLGMMLNSVAGGSSVGLVPRIDSTGNVELGGKGTTIYDHIEQSDGSDAASVAFTTVLRGVKEQLLGLNDMLPGQEEIAKKTANALVLEFANSYLSKMDNENLRLDDNVVDAAVGLASSPEFRAAYEEQSPEVRARISNRMMTATTSLMRDIITQDAPRIINRSITGIGNFNEAQGQETFVPLMSTDPLVIQQRIATREQNIRDNSQNLSEFIELVVDPRSGSVFFRQLNENMQAGDVATSEKVSGVVNELNSQLSKRMSGAVQASANLNPNGQADYQFAFDTMVLGIQAWAPDLRIATSGTN